MATTFPLSGPISMSQMNTFVGSPFGTSPSNIFLSSGSSVNATSSVLLPTGSLFYYASKSGSIDQFAPHRMGEWYGYTLYNKTGLFAKTASGSNGEVVWNVNSDPNVFGWLNSASLTATGTQVATLNLNVGDIVYVNARRLSDGVLIQRCIQTASAYCTTFTCSVFTVTAPDASFDIYVNCRTAFIC